MWDWEAILPFWTTSHPTCLFEKAPLLFSAALDEALLHTSIACRCTNFLRIQWENLGQRLWDASFGFISSKTSEWNERRGQNVYNIGTAQSMLNQTLSASPIQKSWDAAIIVLASRFHLSQKQIDVPWNLHWFILDLWWVWCPKRSLLFVLPQFVTIPCHHFVCSNC